MASTGEESCKQKDFPHPLTPFSPAQLGQAHLTPPSSLSLIPPLPRVLTPNIVQTDDHGHHHLPHRPQCPLSQLLISSDAWGGRGRKDQVVVQEARGEVRSQKVWELGSWGLE